MRLTKMQQEQLTFTRELVPAETVDEICAAKERGEIEAFTDALNQEQKNAVFQLAHMLRKSPLRAFALLA